MREADKGALKRLVPPQAHSLVLPTTADLLTVRAPVHSVHLVIVAREILGELARPDIPDLQGVVARAGDEQAGISREGALVYMRNVAAQGIYEFSITRTITWSVSEIV